MSWVYCSKCGEGIDAPTPLEVLENSYQCPHCGHLEDPQMTIVDVVIGLLGRIEVLEAKGEGGSK